MILLHWIEQNAQALWSTCSLTFCQDQGRQSRSSQCRADGITLLVNIDPAVPTAPGLCGGKHATTTTHLQWSQGSTFHTKRLLTPNSCSHQSKINIFLCFWSNAQISCFNNTTESHSIWWMLFYKATYLHVHSAHLSLFCWREQPLIHKYICKLAQTQNIRQPSTPAWDSRQLSLCVESDANYTIIARVAYNQRFDKFFK